MSDLGLYRMLGSNLIWEGKKFLNKATPVKKTIWNASQVTNAVRSATKLEGNKVYSADEKHYTTDIETWKMIIDSDWTSKKEWIEDHFDCDNFAGSFSAHVADIYGLNSAGRVTVELRDAVTDKHIGYHRCVIIVDDKLDCWLLESQDDRMIKMTGDRFVIGNWRYIPLYWDVN
jgi:hypothetical protein